MFDENRDVDDFLELFRINFGKPRSREYFEWKYVQNPFRLNIHTIIVAEENNRLVGARGAVFSRMMIKGNEIYTTQGTDTMVHPEFRGQGIHIKMVKYV